MCGGRGAARNGEVRQARQGGHVQARSGWDWPGMAGERRTENYMSPGPDRRAQLVLVSSARSKKLSRVSVEAELLYYKLLLVTDDAGRYPASALLVGAACCEHRMERGEATRELVESWLRELERVELLRLYVASDGDRYLELSNLHRPTRKDRKPVRHYPDPVADQAITGQPDDVGCQLSGQPDGNWQDQPHPHPHTHPHSEGANAPARSARRDGKAELRAALEAYEAELAAPLRSDLLTAAEAYRARRVDLRAPLWTRDQWLKTFRVAGHDQGALIEALCDADRSGWKSVHPKASGRYAPRRSPGTDSLASLTAKLKARGIE